MSLVRKMTAVTAAALMAASLGGCVSVFPKTKPAQLYRFGVAAPPAEAAPRAAVVVKGTFDFNPASAGDRILTSDGSSVAYIAGARWVSAASTLFDAALDRAFDAPGAPMLVPRSRASMDTPVLNLDVETFETRYQGGASPTVVVALHAELVRPSDRATVAEKLFRIETPAADNRVGPIVDAYDASVAKVLGDLAAWTAGYAKG